MTMNIFNVLEPKMIFIKFSRDKDLYNKERKTSKKTFGK